MTKVTIKALSGETNAENISTLNGVECQDDFVEYFEPLVTDELEILPDYTQGQWSDGIGEGFEQSPCAEENGEEIFVSPWFRGQKAVAIQK